MKPAGYTVSHIDPDTHPDDNLIARVCIDHLARTVDQFPGEDIQVAVLHATAGFPCEVCQVSDVSRETSAHRHNTRGVDHTCYGCPDRNVSRETRRYRLSCGYLLSVTERLQIGVPMQCPDCGKTGIITGKITP